MNIILTMNVTVIRNQKDYGKCQCYKVSYILSRHKKAV